MVLAAAFAIAAAWPTRAGYFLGDDFGYLQLFHQESWRTLLHSGDISGGIWGQPLDEVRPLFAIAYKLGVLLHGLDPASWHRGSIVLHGLAAALVCILAGAAGLPSRTALLAGCLFAVAPPHAETVAWITGLVDLLPTLFYLASLLSFWRFRRTRSSVAYGASLLAFACGLLCKEILLTLPVLLVIADRALVRAPGALRARVYAPFALVTGLYLTMRYARVGTFAREDQLGLGLRRAVADSVLRVRYLLLPVDDARVAALLGLLLVALLLSLWRQGLAARGAGRLLLFFGVAWPAVTFAPLFVTYVSPRHLYLPSVGIAIAIAVLVLPPVAGRPSWARLAVAVGLLSLDGLALVRSETTWVEAGRTSRAIQQDLAERLSRLPPGEVVVVMGVPAATGPGVALWDVALPFALQPPHFGADLYAAQAVLESPDVYCCPSAVWWERKRGVLRSLSSGDGAERVGLTALFWQGSSFTQARGSLSRDVIRGTLAATLGGHEVRSPAVNRFLTRLASEIVASEREALARGQ